MKNKEIIENIPIIDLSDLDFEKDYVDGLIELTAKKEFQLQIQGDYWLDFDVTIKKLVNVIEADYLNPEEEDIKSVVLDVDNITFYNDGEFVEKGNDFYKMVENYIKNSYN